MFDSDNPFGRWQAFELDNFFHGSLLTMGIVKSNPEFVRQGLEQGEDPNSRYSYEEDNDSITIPNPVRKITPIVQAAVIGSLPITKLLVEYGADVNMCQQNGESALANAANRGNTELVTFLLSHGADPNIPDSDGDLPIIGSIDANNLDEIELLISYGTDMTYRNNQGETPLDRAKRRGNFSAVDALMHNTAQHQKEQPSDLSATTEDQFSTQNDLVKACTDGDFYRALALLKAGADPTENTPDGLHPLFYCKEVDLVCLLEQFGADVNAIDNEGNTVIVNFLTEPNINSNGERAIVFLIEAGLDVDRKNADGMSARDIANSIQDYELRAAFDQGLGIVEKREQAFKGKMEEQKRNRNEWYEEINPLQQGDSWEIEIANCFNACALSDLDVLKAKEDFVRDNLTVTMGGEGTNMRNMLMMACSDASVEVVEYLLSIGADPNQTDNTGQNSLRYAAISWRDSAEKINLLVGAGAEVNHRSNDGSAALSDAAYEHNASATKALLANGADVNNRDSQGYTALSWSCGKGAPDADVVELLLRAGADVADLYNMNCVLQYLDYNTGYMSGMPREVFLSPDELKEKYLYERALLPALISQDFKQRLISQGFSF